MRSLGRDELIFLVYADDPGSIAFAERFGQEVDYRLQQIRTVGVEEPAVWPEGIEGVALDGRREELLRAAWPLALQGHEDMPLPGRGNDRPRRMVARRGNVPRRLLRCAPWWRGRGLRGPTRTRRRSRRGRARADRRAPRLPRPRDRLRAQARPAPVGGRRPAFAQLVTWTQKGNEPMQTLNRRLGYVDHARVLVYVGATLGADG